MVEAATLRNWSKGLASDATNEDGGEITDADLGESESGDLEDLEVVFSSLWNGDVTDTLTEGDLDDFAGFMGDSESEIWGAALSLASALIDGDESASDEALQKLHSAEQFLSDEYPQFDEDQREASFLLMKALKADKEISASDVAAIALIESRVGAGLDDEDSDEEEESGEDESEELEDEASLEDDQVPDGDEIF